MKSLAYLLIGMLFGITMFKSEAASWFRIYEMFKFDAFHMYGIIGSALLVGVLASQTLKRLNIKTLKGEPIPFVPKSMSFSRYMFGGIIFGLGWALAGACPGPMFTLAGAGYFPIFVVIISAIVGTFVYGKYRSRLPH